MRVSRLAMLLTITLILACIAMTTAVVAINAKSLSNENSNCESVAQSIRRSKLDSVLVISTTCSIVSRSSSVHLDFGT
jgi:hypothetical protein